MQQHLSRGPEYSGMAGACPGWPIRGRVAQIHGVGSVIRRTVEESPVFEELHERRKETSVPLRQLFRGNTREVTLAALIFVGNNAAGYLLLAFFISYGQTVLHLPSGQVLAASTFAAAGWLGFTLLGGVLGDKIGQVRTFQIGYILLALWAVPMWFILDSANIYLFCGAMIVLALPLGLTYGPQAALYANLFPTRIRYSGVSIGYALGSILGGAFAPTIAQWILSTYGRSWLIGVYLVILSVVSFVAVSIVGRPSRLDLGND
jgi:MFS family permease